MDRQALYESERRTLLELLESIKGVYSYQRDHEIVPLYRLLAIRRVVTALLRIA
jgi:hypothetical protein